MEDTGREGSLPGAAAAPPARGIFRIDRGEIAGAIGSNDLWVGAVLLALPQVPLALPEETRCPPTSSR
jgi:hypothetical protein